MTNDLPEAWSYSNLESLSSDISYGYTAKASAENIGPHLLRITDIQNNSVNWSQVPFCAIGYAKKEKYLLCKGDLLFARTGATVGKSHLIKDEIPESVYASYLIRVRSLLGDDNQYLAHFFNSKAYWQQITDFSAGIGQPSVNGTKLKQLQIPVPPLLEQKAIAEKLDSLLAQVEATKTRLEGIPEILKQLRQSVLAAAVSGELTEDWRVENKVTKDSWVMSSVGDVGSVATGKTPKRTENKYWDSGTIPWLTSAATGQERIYKAEQFVTQVSVKECGLKIFDIGTLLLAMYGEGKTRGQVAEMMLAATCNQACAAITANEKIRTAYLKLVLMANYEETRKAAAGGNQPNLNLKKVRDIAVFLPKRKEQKEIVLRVEELFTFANKIETKAKTALENVNHLTQSILAQAFSGELTKEWREQNPDLISGENSAEALLERIKAEREKLKPVKKTRKKKA